MRIRQATIEDQEQIGRFLQVAYEDRAQYKFPARWVWEFVNNPFWNREGLPVWLAEVRGQIIGQVGLMPVPLKLGDRVYSAAWGADYFVLPEFRRQGVLRRLQQAHDEYHDVFVGLYMSSISRRFVVGLGFEEVNPVIELCKSIRFSPEQARTIVDNKLGTGNILSRACRRRRAGVALAAFFSLLMRLRDLARPRPGMHNVALERVERFGDEIDQLWTRLAPCFPVIVQRDAVYLNWKFVEQPSMDYHKFVARRAQTVCGYVITRTGVPPEARVGIIADLFVAPDDDVVIRCLLVHAIRHLRRAGVHNIIAASSVPEYVAHFLQQGFRRTGDVIPLFTGEIVGRCPTNGWFFSMGDHDWDQYPLMTGAQPRGG